MPNTYKIVNKRFEVTSNGAETGVKTSVLCIYELSDGINTLVVPYSLGENYSNGESPDAATIENADDDVLTTANG